MLLLHMAATILYFNIPAQYFRPFDRHYLPVCVTIAVLAAYGMAAGLQLVIASLRTRPRVLALSMTSLAALVPVGQLIRNWQSHDASNRHFARDFAANALQTLPPHAIVLTARAETPLHPVVRFITDANCAPLEKPYDVDLFERSVAGRPSPIRKVLLKPAYKAL